VTHTIKERERMALSATTIAQVLKDAGYSTGIFGKWHLGDASPYQPEHRGFDEVFIHGAGGIGQSYEGTQSNPPNNGHFDPAIKHNDRFVRTKGYCTDVFFKQALGWMRDCQKENKPFFAYIPTNAPHGPFVVAEKYSNLYKGKCDDKVAAFLGMITNIDENMGLLMQKLDEWKLADSTLLIFMTDNGTVTGHKVYNAGMRGNKLTPNEGGSRVPLFMRLPGRTEPAVDVDRLTRHVDIFPTLAEIAGARTPEGLDLDGRSLWPLVDDPKCEWKDRYTFFHTGRWKSVPDATTNHRGCAVRNERWRMVSIYLYDIEKDPGETTNAARANPEVVKEMRAAFDAWWDEVRPLMINEGATLKTGKPFRDQYRKQEASTGIPDWVEPEL
jgi:arylsulfatase A-like enzyme